MDKVVHHQWQKDVAADVGGGAIGVLDETTRAIHMTGVFRTLFFPSLATTITILHCSRKFSTCDEGTVRNVPDEINLTFVLFPSLLRYTTTKTELCKQEYDGVRGIL